MLDLLAILTGDHDALIGDGEVSRVATLRAPWILISLVQDPKLFENSILARSR
jgi:hypothetical protein